jgi:NAD(P)H-dependent flavin oxidoreductase YrpB (nitropropane dioxygenase family)
VKRQGKKQGKNRKKETKGVDGDVLQGKQVSSGFTEEQALELGLLDLVAAVLELHVAGMCGKGAAETTNRRLV